MHLVSDLKSNEANRRGRRRPSSQLESLMSEDCCDRTLVLRAQSGEHGAFNALVRRYRDRLMKEYNANSPLIRLTSALRLSVNDRNILRAARGLDSDGLNGYDRQLRFLARMRSRVVLRDFGY
jgi:hypothetical protein